MRVLLLFPPNSLFENYSELIRELKSKEIRVDLKFLLKDASSYDIIMLFYREPFKPEYPLLDDFLSSGGKVIYHFPNPNALFKEFYLYSEKFSKWLSEKGFTIKDYLRVYDDKNNIGDRRKLLVKTESFGTVHIQTPYHIWHDKTGRKILSGNDSSYTISINDLYGNVLGKEICMCASVNNFTVISGVVFSNSGMLFQGNKKLLSRVIYD